MKTKSLYLLLGALALTNLFECGAALAAPGDLYLSESADGLISKFSPDGTKSTFASDLDSPGGLVFDRVGNLFVSVGSQPGSIIKFTPGGEMTVFASGLSLPGALAFNGASHLFATESFGDVGDILEFTPEGTKSIFVSLGNLQPSLAFDSKSILFAAIGGPTLLNGGIVWFTPDGVPHTFLEMDGPGMAFDAAGNLYVTSYDDILKFTPLPEREGSVFVSGFNSAAGLAFDPAGNLFVADAGTGSIFKVTPDGTKTTFATGLNQPIFLAFEPVPEKLRNISARALVGTEDNVLIGGFIVGGNALANNAVLVRAIGPSLSQAGVSNPLADPALELHNASGALIASNDDWQDDQETEITATGLAPGDPNESTIYATLPAGSYTAVVRGAGDTTGVALVEVYSVSQ